MKTTKFRLALGLIVGMMAIGLLASNQVTLAQSGGGYDLTWSTLDGGGGTSAGGNYSLSGTLGQFDAGTLTGSADGKSYTLAGGFWVNLQAYKVYLPVVLR